MIEHGADPNVVSLFKKCQPLTIIFSDMPKNIDFDQLSMKFDDSDDNSYYIGQWNDDAEEGQERQGYGILMFRHGDLYEGFWDEGRYEYFGRLIQTNGKIYQGQFKNNQPHGAGVTIKTKYEQSGKKRTEYRHKGYYQKGKYHGFGVLDYTKKFKYEGWFQKGMMNGPKSKIEYSNGVTYTGTIVNGRKQGNGVLVYEDGSKYEGAFTNDQPDGQGKYIQINSNGELIKKYIGGFKQGKKHGIGEIIRPFQKNATKVVYNEGNIISDQ